MRSNSIVANFSYRDINYKVQKSNRKTVTVKVSKKAGVVVVIPMGCDPAISIDAVEKSYEWIKKCIKKFEEQRSTIIEQSYVAGSTHLYLGDRYTLKIERGSIYQLQLVDDKIIVTTPKSDRVEKMMDIWYMERAKQDITPIFIEMSRGFESRHNTLPSDLEYKFVTSYWGQCTSDNKIRLNANLIRAPRECIEYIIAHELCHLIHKNHSRSFYALLDNEMPNWREYNKILNSTISIKR